jgi:hypothetical protein
MLEVWFGVALGLLIASNVALWLKLHNCYSALSGLIREKSAIVEKTVDMTEIREEIADTVNDFLGGLHVPSGVDHMWGMLAQVGGSILQKRFGNVAQMIPDMVQPNDDLN